MSELLRTWENDADAHGFEFFTMRAAWQMEVVRHHPHGRSHRDYRR